MMNIKKANIPKTHELTSFNVKEIVNKYPDKVISIENRNSSVFLTLDTCILIFNSTFPKESSIERINKQLRNNKHN